MSDGMFQGCILPLDLPGQTCSMSGDAFDDQISSLKHHNHITRFMEDCVMQAEQRSRLVQAES